jgi:outer membrane lipoprotein-sorting protein
MTIKTLTAAAALAFGTIAALPMTNALTARAQADDSAAQLAQVQAHLRGTTSMVAAFTQIDRTGQRLTGTLTLKKPGRIRFQYQKDVPLLIVADGNSLTLIDYEVRQVQRWPVKNSPLAALLDPDRNLATYAKLQPTTRPDVISVEVRDAKRPEYGMITLVFTRDGSAPAGLRLRGWVALDSQNNRTRIDLSNQRFNVPVPDSAFKWRDPRPNQRR